MIDFIGLCVYLIAVFAAMVVVGMLSTASTSQTPHLPVRKTRTSDTSRYEVVKVDLKGKVKP